MVWPGFGLKLSKLRDSTAVVAFRMSVRSSKIQRRADSPSTSRELGSSTVLLVCGQCGPTVLPHCLGFDTARASVGLQARFTFLLGSKTKGSDERFGMSGFPTSLLLQNVPLFNPYTWVQMTSLSHIPHLAIYCTYCRCRGC